MRRHITRKRIGLLLLLLTVGLAGTVLLERETFTQRLALRWQRQLDSAPEEEVRLLLEQMRVLGNPAIPSLVAALGSSRESVARGSKSVLWEEIDRWKSLEVDDSQSKVLCLARALVEQVPQFGPTARCDAAALAVRILREFPAIARGPVTAACEEVLRITTPERNLLATRRGVDRGAWVAEEANGGRVQPAVAASPLWSRPLEPVGPLAAASSLAGGGIPLELPVVSRESQMLAKKADSSSADAPRKAPKAAEADALAQRASGSDSGRDLATPRSTANSEAAAGLGNLAHVDTVEVMRQLHTGRAREAEADLRRRGFNDVHLELARQLFDPDPRVRKSLVELLPGLQSVDAVPWLLQLCRDEDAEVRLNALALVATTKDPALRAEAERLARQDADPRLREQATRMAKHGQPTIR